MVRKHLGVMTAHGVIVCTREFSALAIAFVGANGIELVNGDALVRLIEQARGGEPSRKDRIGRDCYQPPLQGIRLCGRSV